MTAAPEIPADVMAAAREALAVEYERTEYGGGPYPTYADLARGGSGSFTLCSIRAIARAILAERQRCVDVAITDSGEVIGPITSDVHIYRLFGMPFTGASI